MYNTAPFVPSDRNSTTWKNPISQSAMSNFSTANIKSAHIFPDQVIDLPKSFTDSLAQIDAFKGKFREAKYHLIASVYLACHLGYKNKTKPEIEANDKILIDMCTALEINGRTYYQRLGKIAFGNDSKRVSSIIHVIKVAEQHSVEPGKFVEWLKNEGGIQKIRTTYNVGGGSKDGAPSKSGKIAKAHEKNDRYYIEKAKADLTSSAKATIPAGELPVIDLIGNERECTAILLQRADGSFEVKVVLNDKDLVEQLYCAHGRVLSGENN